MTANAGFSQDIFITYAKRTPIGSFGGTLSKVRVDDLLAHLIRDLRETYLSFDPTEIDDVVIGCANQAGEDNRNLARMASILGGLPFDVPGTTINRLCGSSMDAVIDAVSRISLGLGDCFLAGGAENMSRAPYVLGKAASAFDRGQTLYDTSLGWRFPNPKMEEMFPLFTMGETAEEVARLHKVARNRQDEFALSSHLKALKSQEDGVFKDELVAVPVSGPGNTLVNMEKDEGPRANTSLEKLAKLRPAFRADGTVTAGNSSSLNDGASLVMVVSAAFLRRHKLRPLVRFTGAGVRGLHPNTMGLGPVGATETLCKRFQLKVKDFDLVELNEAFAAQALASMDLLQLDPAIVNRRGGSIALGHPLGCSGTRILTTLIHQMKGNSALKKGLATMCIGVGQGIAMSVENCST